jgi:hypothetical protein
VGGLTVGCGRHGTDGNAGSRAIRTLPSRLLLGRPIRLRRKGRSIAKRLAGLP